MCPKVCDGGMGWDQDSCSVTSDEDTQGEEPIRNLGKQIYDGSSGSVGFTHAGWGEGVSNMSVRAEQEATSELLSARLMDTIT